MPMSCAAEVTITGARIESRTPRWRQASSSCVGDLLALEVLGQDVVVGLGGGLEQLVAAARDLVGQLGRDLDLGALAASPRRTPCGGRGRRSP